MLFSTTAVVLSTFASALATTHAELRIRHAAHAAAHANHTAKIYARADVVGKTGVHARFEFIGTAGNSTLVKIHGLEGLFANATLPGPFGYHIHTNPVGADGDCAKTLAHLDPLSVTEGFVCDPAFPQYCQTGDLSGKHGKFNGTSDGVIAAFAYTDAYVRFFPESHSLLGRSIVIHSANKTRIACGNITSTLDGTANKGSHTPTYQPSTYVTHYPAVAPTPPGPPIIPFNGTVMTDPAVIATFPYPLPVPALSLAEAPNVRLGNITHSVKYNNSEQTITQPNETKDDGAPPFKGC